MNRLLVVGTLASALSSAALAYMYNKVNVTGVTQRFLLTITREILPGHNRYQVAINGSIPGPTLYIALGNKVEVTVINEVFDDYTAIHWHGISALGVPWMDGLVNFTQCPLTNVPGYNRYTYTFTPDMPGTYWYHGHVNSQYPDGLYGALVVQDAEEVRALSEHGAAYSVDEPQWVFMLADYYQTEVRFLEHAFLQPNSGGLDPVPDSFTVNNQFTDSFVIPVQTQLTPRMRLVNAAAYSPFRVSIDGLPLQIIEVDGSPVQPEFVSSVTLFTAQRISVVLHWDLLNRTDSPIYLRVELLPDIYPTYDVSQPPHYNMIGSTSGQPLSLFWKAELQLDQPPSSAPPQSVAVRSDLDINLSQLQPLFASTPPPSTHYLVIRTQFYLDFDNVVRGYINEETFGTHAMVEMPPSFPMLFKVMGVPDPTLSEYGGESVGALRKTNRERARHLPSGDQAQADSSCFAQVEHQCVEGVQEEPPHEPTPFVPRHHHHPHHPHPTSPSPTMAPTSSWSSPPLALPPQPPSRSPLVLQESPLPWRYNVTGLTPIAGDGAHPFHLPYNATVDILIDGQCCGAHPFHLHGHHFWIMASSESSSSSSASAPPLIRDVVTVPFGGWVVIRIVANNPGVWLFHCHLHWHFAIGLAAVFVEGAPELRTGYQQGKYDVEQAALDLCTAPEVQTLGPPTMFPSTSPTLSSPPSAFPVQSDSPSAGPTMFPSEGTQRPSEAPSAAPSEVPSAAPSEAPSAAPSEAPSAAPSEVPSAAPSDAPSAAPSEVPSAAPSEAPSAAPSDATIPSVISTQSPSEAPFVIVSEAPSLLSTTQPPHSLRSDPPSKYPTAVPSQTPTEDRFASSSSSSFAPSGVAAQTPSPYPTTKIPLASDSLSAQPTSSGTVQDVLQVRSTHDAFFDNSTVASLVVFALGGCLGMLIVGSLSSWCRSRYEEYYPGNHRTAPSARASHLSQVASLHAHEYSVHSGRTDLEAHQTPPHQPSTHGGPSEAVSWTPTADQQTGVIQSTTREAYDEPMLQSSADFPATTVSASILSPLPTTNSEPPNPSAALWSTDQRSRAFTQNAPLGSSARVVPN